MRLLPALSYLRLPGYQWLPATGCSSDVATVPFFAYRCLSGAELATGLTANAEPVEVEALLDFCALNPYAHVVARPSSLRSYEWVREDTDARLDMPLCGRGSEDYDVSVAFVAPLPRARQWGDGDPCTPAPGWFGITCDAGGHIIRMCVRAHAFATRMRLAKRPNILQNAHLQKFTRNGYGARSSRCNAAGQLQCIGFTRCTEHRRADISISKSMCQQSSYDATKSFWSEIGAVVSRLQLHVPPRASGGVECDHKRSRAGSTTRDL